jgi:hypothetical protein
MIAPKMPRGTVRRGSFTSSAMLASVSKPMNAKNAMKLPARTPRTPASVEGSIPAT